MHPFHLAYLVPDAGARAAFFGEHARRSAEFGHVVTVLSDRESPLPRADFFLAAGAESAIRAVEAGLGLPLHWVLDPPRFSSDPEILDRALRLPTFKLTTDARVQQQLQRRYRSRCWCLPDPMSPLRDRRIQAVSRDAWRVLVVGEGSDDELQCALDAIREVRERGFELHVSRLSSGPLNEVEAMSGQLDRWIGDPVRSARRAIYRDIDVVLVVGDDISELGAEVMPHGPSVVRLDGGGGPSGRLRFGRGPNRPNCDGFQSEHPAPVIEEGALHVPRADSGAAADALDRIFADPGLRLRLSEDAHRVSGMWGWTEHLSRFHAVLQEIAVTYGSTYGHDRRAKPRSPIRSLNSALLDRQIDFAESLVADRHVTVIGCGRTDIAVRLAEHGADAVTALDPSDIALAFAARNRAHPNVRYEKLGQALDLEPTDVVIALDPLARSVDAAAVVRAAATKLNPGGALLLSAPARGAPDAGSDPSLAFANETWLERHLSLLQESFQKVIPLGQCDVEGDLVIGPEHVAPESLSYLLLAIHPTLANPPDVEAREAAEPIDIRDVRSESRKRRRAA